MAPIVATTEIGVGRALVPLIVRREAEREMPENLRHLKERLERRRPD